ncbi:MAG: hypothetical protein ABI327_12090 [Burkholderiaceae bacterium]
MQRPVVQAQQRRVWCENPGKTRVVDLDTRKGFYALRWAGMTQYAAGRQ